MLSTIRAESELKPNENMYCLTISYASTQFISKPLPTKLLRTNNSSAAKIAVGLHAQVSIRGFSPFSALGKPFPILLSDCMKTNRIPQF